MYTNIWYVAARSSELEDKPLHTQMLGTNFVLFRDKKGLPAFVRVFPRIIITLG